MVMDRILYSNTAGIVCDTVRTLRKHRDGRVDTKQARANNGGIGLRTM